MENQEHENLTPEEVIAEQTNPANETPEVQVETAETASTQPQQPPVCEQIPQGYYHGAGAGRTEAPYGTRPYVTYHYPPQGAYQQPVRQPWQQPYTQSQQPWQVTPPQPPVQPKPAKPKKPKKERRLTKLVAAILVMVLIATGCGVSILLTNMHWRDQFALLSQRFSEQLDVLEQQLREENAAGNGAGAGQLQPGETMTASEIYTMNVNSVVAITSKVQKTEYGQVYEGTSAGTGFIITEDGYVVTNHHVIDGASKIIITMNNGMEYSARLIGSDATNDVALLKVDATGFKPVTIGSSSQLRVGDQVVAIGNALGELTSSLTVGYVSGIDRDIATDGSIINMIQTDAAINSGNSGGPLFNAQGQVIGITTAKYSGTTGSGASIEGISFAIPMDDVMGLLDDLREYGYVRSAYLGVMVRDMDPDVANAYGLPMGVYASDVTAGACAAVAGVRAKDIIIGLGGYQIENMNDLSRALRAYEAGETVTLTVWRSGVELILSVTLDAKPQN